MSRTVTQTLSADLDERRDGAIFLYAEYDIHPDLRALTISFPDILSVASTHGFSKSGRHECEWDTTTMAPSVTFRLDVNRNNGRGYEFIDTGGWAVFRHPPFGHSWSYTGSNIELERKYEARDNGVTSADGSVAYLGPHAEYRDSSAEQTFRLIIPEAATLQPSVDSIFQSLCHASDALSVGATNDEVLIVAVPSDINWGYLGMQSGDNGYWVVDSNRVNDAHNTWVHEYIHTRQDWEKHSSTRWLVEATTEYYAALLSLRQGRISFEQFYRHATTNRHSDSVLVDPQRWSSSRAYYTKGRRVLAALDAKIRKETDGRRTFQQVFKQINTTDGSFTHQQFREIVTDVAGSSLGGWVSTYVEGSAVPDVPENERLFTEGVIPTPADRSGPEKVEDSTGGPTDDATGTDETGTDETGPVDEPDTCPICDATVDATQEYCDTCGTTLNEQCPVCGRAVTDELYCPECGTTLHDECDVCGYRCNGSEEYCPQCGTTFN